MFAVLACLAGIFVILVIEEIFYKYKVLHGENLRKFVHMTAGTFIAFWPWLISWGWIELISLAMLAVVFLNHQTKTIHMSGQVLRHTYGGLLFPIGVMFSAALTHNKVIFALAILHMALADGLAAVIGTAYGKKTQYKVFHQVKSWVGTMTFWITSIFILGMGLLFLSDVLSYSNYIWLMIFMPPLLAGLENIGGLGLDNILVPVAVVVILGALG